MGETFRQFKEKRDKTKYIVILQSRNLDSLVSVLDVIYCFNPAFVFSLTPKSVSGKEKQLNVTQIYVVLQIGLSGVTKWQSVLISIYYFGKNLLCANSL